MNEVKLPGEMLFVQVPELMFNINLVQGIEYRSKTCVLMVIFKGGHYHTKKTELEEFTEIKKQFLSLVEKSDTLHLHDYVVCNNLIFTVKKLAAIEYRGPSNGSNHIVRFKDGQYLTPFLSDVDYKKMIILAQDAIISNAVVVEPCDGI